jgi:hypothetical protein
MLAPGRCKRNDFHRPVTLITERKKEAAANAAAF